MARQRDPREGPPLWPWVVGLLAVLAVPASCVSVLVIAGTGHSRADVTVAHGLADRLVRTVGVEPDARIVSEGYTSLFDRVRGSVQLRWVRLELGDDPIAELAAALEDAGFTVTRMADQVPRGRPRVGGADPAELEACVAGSDPRAGASVSVGRTAAGLEVAADVGRGGVASAGCLRLDDAVTHGVGGRADRARGPTPQGSPWPAPVPTIVERRP